MLFPVSIDQLTPTELARWQADTARPQPLLLDVREPWELAICRIAGSENVPLRELPSRLADLPSDRPIVCICHHGGRSQHAAMVLKSAGLQEVYNLQGGVAGWAREVDPAMPRY